MHQCREKPVTSVQESVLNGFCTCAKCFAISISLAMCMVQCAKLYKWFPVCFQFVFHFAFFVAAVILKLCISWNFAVLHTLTMPEITGTQRKYASWTQTLPGTVYFLSVIVEDFHREVAYSFANVYLIVDFVNHFKHIFWVYMHHSHLYCDTKG